MTNDEFQSLVLKELGSIKGDLSVLKEDVSSLKQDVSGLKQDVSGLKQDVRVLKEDVVSLKEGQSRLEVRLERVESKLDAVNDQTAFLTEFRTETNIKLDNILEENVSIHEILGRHDVAISTLKRKVG